MRTFLLLPFLFGGCDLDDDKDEEEEDEEVVGEPVDLVLLLDASDSMMEEATDLALSLDALVEPLDDAGIPWRIGVTTVSVYFDGGRTTGIDPGETGTLVDDTLFEDVESARAAALCGATCWSESDLPSDPGYTCGDTAPAEITREYLDCTCGVGEWEEHCGSGTEEGLEAMALAMCRADDDPPEACWVAIESNAAGTNPPLGTAGRVAFLLLSDEGDSSRRATTGDTDVTDYVDLVTELGGATFHGVGPFWDGMNGDCLDSAQSWGVDRYQRMAAETGGTWSSLTDADCAPQDLAGIFAGVGEALAAPPEAPDTGDTGADTGDTGEG